MNILFVTIAWPIPGERNLYSDLMSEFAIHGHNVYVLCADSSISVSKAAIENNLQVLRVNSFQVRKVNKIRKAFALLTLGSKLKRTLIKHWPSINIELLISNSPPVTISACLRSIKKRFNVPLYYLLKDIWPQGPVDLNLIKKHSIFYFYFKYHERSIYKTADYIGCMSSMNRDYILSNYKYLSKDKVEVCPNSIKPRNLSLSEDYQSIRKKFNIPNSATLFIFSGNLGKAHGLDFYMDAIERLKEFNNAYFLVGGSGQYYNYVKQEIKKRQLHNIGIYHRLPSVEFDQLLQVCDVGVILLDHKYTVPQFPSRLLSYLEAKKPILCSVNNHTDIGRIIDENQCGIATLNGDMNSFVQAVKYFCDKRNAETIEKMRQNSYFLLHQRYTTTQSYKIIMKHFS